MTVVQVNVSMLTCLIFEVNVAELLWLVSKEMLRRLSTTYFNVVLMKILEKLTFRGFLYVLV